MAEEGTFMGEIQRGVARFWSLRWRVKGPILAIAAFVVLGIIGSVVGGSEPEGTSPAAGVAVQTPTEMKDSRPTSSAQPMGTAALTEDPPATEIPEPTKTSEPTATPEPTPEGPPSIGQVAEVGDLDLTVLSAVPFDASVYNPFNEANFAVTVRATNARGDGLYEINPLSSFRIIDASGIARDSSFGCAGCPNELESVGILPGASLEGVVYFELPEGAVPVQLLFDALLSFNSATIELR